jgi:hypothetical protein
MHIIFYAFPDMRGMASSMCISMRQALTGGIIFISSLFFDGSMMPVALTTLVLAILGVGAYAMLNKINV